MTDLLRGRKLMILAVATCVASASAFLAPLKTSAKRFVMEKVTFKSDGLTLVGYLFRPPGPGKFPAIVWNHGSEQDPAPDRQFQGVADIFVPEGYVVFCPVRRGQGESQGKYISDVVAKEKMQHGAVAAEKLMVQLMAGQQLDDQLAGLAFLKKRDFVDKSRIAVVGCSYGGIETLLGAESGSGYKVAVALSPGAESWNGNPFLRDRLVKAADHIHIPTFIIHPERDANTAPGYRLGQEFQSLNKPYSLKIFPPIGSTAEQGHCFGGAVGMHIWGPDAVQFIKHYMP